jgi:SM-20-related protein
LEWIRATIRNYSEFTHLNINSYLRLGDQTPTDVLFESIAQDLIQKGFSIQQNAVPTDLSNLLHFHLINMAEYKFNEASVGRNSQQQKNEKIRNDDIAWIHGNSPAGIKWLQWTQSLQVYLNRRLFLGLFSFESHFAHYAKGNYYKRHLDAFKGQANRVLSLVTYLNPEWQDEDGGELVIYTDSNDENSIKVLPKYGTLVVFLSEDFEHEVKPALSDRYSIAGWFRVNASKADKADPPA